jgi:serine protease AprX
LLINLAGPCEIELPVVCMNDQTKSLSRQDLEDIIYRSPSLRRFTQDSPVLPDVWFAFGLNPHDRLDLLLVPFHGVPPGALAIALRQGGLGPEAEIAYHESTVAASLSFAELVKNVLPLAYWRKELGSNLKRWLQIPHLSQAELHDMAVALSAFERGRMDLVGRENDRSDTTSPLVLWTVRLVGSIQLAQEGRARELRDKPSGRIQIPLSIESAESVLTAARGLIKPDHDDTDPEQLIFSISRNRSANVTVNRSVPTVKADAARRLFGITDTELRWAVIDSGIDARHLAFRRRDRKSDSLEADPFAGKGQTRVVETYDFTPVRQLLDADKLRQRTFRDPVKDAQLLRNLDEQDDLAKELQATLDAGGSVSWLHFAPLLRIPHDAAYHPPVNEHGTHVAAILAGDWRTSDHETTDGAPIDPPDYDLVGVVPTLELYDLRVLGDDGSGDEFAVMAALQYIRGTNSSADFLTVHGVNLSMAIKHDVANYACGRTPICEEATRLVASGAVVVAAAGNEGYVRNPADPVDFDEGYRSISITDPGNAEEVITVGATHGYRPLTYGVSYFSSRGPTGDGRRKPDLVAPGEKIWSAVPNGGVRTLDGTSMAAPHVSGCAALLMARHRELIGDPARVKRVLCASATDLGREPYFQGHGLVDVLRAIQSV